MNGIVFFKVERIESTFDGFRWHVSGNAKDGAYRSVHLRQSDANLIRRWDVVGVQLCNDRVFDVLVSVVRR